MLNADHVKLKLSGLTKIHNKYPLKFECQIKNNNSLSTSMSHAIRGTYPSKNCVDRKLKFN